MIISVKRIWSAPDEGIHLATTTGTLCINGASICFTLERTALMVSTGTYPIKMEWSNRFQRKTPHILDVPGRTDIMLHGANEAEDVIGCIGVGEKRMSLWFIHEAQPATDQIEAALALAEADGEENTITIT